MAMLAMNFSNPWLFEIVNGVIIGLIVAVIIAIVKSIIDSFKSTPRKFRFNRRFFGVTWAVVVTLAIIFNFVKSEIIPALNADNSKYGFEEIDTIWKKSLKLGEGAVKEMGTSQKKSIKGKSSIYFDVHLQYPPATPDTAGSIYVTLPSDLRWSKPVNILNGIEMTGKRITCFVFVPENFPLDTRDQEHLHVMRLFLKDMNKFSVYGEARNIDTPGGWIGLVLFADPQSGEVLKGVFRDPQFNPKKVFQLGVKVSVDTLGPPIDYSGRFYLDAVDWN